jgi:lycopene beta-cyclase
MSSPQYDYIISGMGCSGLSLAVQLSANGLTKGKRILLVDREQKNHNNRTWCFWETQPGPFESIVFRSWEKALFFGHDPVSAFEKPLPLGPYTYKMIRGLDFFTHCLDIIRQDPAFDIHLEEITSISSDSHIAYCKTPSETFTAPYLFNSILFEPPSVKPDTHYLLQHFKGWVVRTPDPVFDPTTPTLMDFRPDQHHGTAFVYVMPFSPNEALIEYTLFTESLLEPNAYDEGLDAYLRNQLGLSHWERIEEEFGVIPMTNHRFPRQHNRILNLGTSGGRTKPSSGYTFTFIQKDTQQIINSLREKNHPFRLVKESGRFHWYDSVLLHILAKRKLPGHFVFTELFRNNPAHRILRFLDNNTRLHEEIRIMASLPQWPFMKAGLREWGK